MTTRGYVSGMGRYDPMNDVTNLGEVYKYPRMPVDNRVDRLEDRLAEQERRIQVASFSTPVVNHDDCDSSSCDYAVVKESSNYDEKESNMSDPQVEKVLVAEDFRKYIGQIVNDIANDRYVEVVEIVEPYVAIKASPSSNPSFSYARDLRIWD